MKKFIEDKKTSILFLASVIAVMWAVFILQQIFPFLTSFGMIPRTGEGAIGIITAPFLHGSLDHIVSNTIMLALFGAFYLFFKAEKLIITFSLTLLASGALMWLFGGSGLHIGMSGVIFGLFSYLILAGIFTKNIKEILVSSLVLFLYGGVLWQLFNMTGNVSFSGHLLGFVSGLILAAKEKK